MTIPISLAQPCSVPITTGVCFPKGALTGLDRLGLRDAEGTVITVQTLPLARWPDGSVKWLLLDFLLPELKKGESIWTLDLQCEQLPSNNSSNLTVTEHSRAIVVQTGTHTFEIDRETFGPFSRVLVGEKDLLDDDASQTVLIDRKGRVLAPRIEEVRVEARGPIRTTLCLEGRFPKCRGLRFRSRLCFFGGTGLVRIRLTLHNPNRAKHPGGLWDLGDPGSFFFQSLALEFFVRSQGTSRMWVEPEVGVNLDFDSEETLCIYQDSSGGENWQSRNHVNCTGRVPCRFRGYRVRTSSEEHTGLRASPVFRLQTDSARLAVAVPHFWQQFPKAIEIEGRRLRVGLFPDRFDDLFELQGGERKTHTIWLDFAVAGQSKNSLGWVHEPARVSPTPEWIASANVFPHFAPATDEPDPQLESYLGSVVRGEKNFFLRREIIDEFGWRNFGEVHADHEAAHYDGIGPIISHYNNQYDLVHGFQLQGLRTGDPIWQELAEPLAHHVIDIDIYHTHRDKVAYNGGAFWHTAHYRDANTSTHRCYSRRSRRPGERSFGGGPSSEHNYTNGLLYHYWLTGCPDAHEAVIGLANWVFRMDDGRRNAFGLIDADATGLASKTTDTDYHGPGRGSGNSINTLLNAWLLTDEAVYRDKAEELIRRSIHPKDDIAARELLDAERRWSYTVFLSVLDRYLDLKTERGQIDEMYCFARASLINHAEWMLENERPYLDHPEELEFPTETWAAQELRKANVLRRAARYAEEPLRTHLFRRGAALAERGWRDLLSFESRDSARAVAIVLQEGPLDWYFRTKDVPPAPQVSEVEDFGEPDTFVPQKRRITAQLKTVQGMIVALLSLSNPLHWTRWRLLVNDPTVRDEND